MAKIVEFHLEERTTREVSAAEFDPRWDDAERIFWVRVDGRPQSLDALAAVLRLSADELEELQDSAALPGVTQRENSLHLVFDFSDPSAPNHALTRFHMLLTRKFCLAAADELIAPLAEFEESYEREFRFAQSTNFMLFLVLDALIDNFTRSLTRLDDRTEVLSDKIYERFDPASNEQIISLQRDVLLLKRMLTHARDTLMRISGRKIPIVSDVARDGLLEIFNHAQALMASVESLRELVGSLHDSFRAMQAQKLNETMKILTLFASVLLPMTLIAGIYGMNFSIMPETKWDFGYPMALGLILASGLGTYAYFRRRDLI